MLDHCLWIVEDDQDAQFVYREILADQLQLQLQFFDSIDQLQQAIESTFLLNPPRGMIADIRLRDSNFMTFLKGVRNRKFIDEVPTIVISSVEDIETLRVAFSAGVVDYLTKPFSRAELLVKVERHFLKAEASNLRLDISTMTFHFGAKCISNLTSKEFQILSVLVNDQFPSVSRDEITNRVWNGLKVSHKVFDVHLSNLRKKLFVLGVKIVLDKSGSYRMTKPLEITKKSGIAPIL